MADDDVRAIPICQKAFKPFQGSQIKVIGRLIQQEQVRVGEQCLGQRHARFLAAGQLVDGHLEHRFRKTKSTQNLSGAKLHLVAMTGVEFGGKAAVLLKQFVKVALRVRSHMLFEFGHPPSNCPNVTECVQCFFVH